jgi:adenylate cyclase
MEYTVIGDSVNVAARLNAVAGPGEVVVSQQVQENLKDLIITEDLGPRTIKGKTEPISTFKVLSVPLKTHASN